MTYVDIPVKIPLMAIIEDTEDDLIQARLLRLLDKIVSIPFSDYEISDEPMIYEKYIDPENKIAFRKVKP